MSFSATEQQSQQSCSSHPQSQTDAQGLQCAASLQAQQQQATSGDQTLGATASDCAQQGLVPSLVEAGHTVESAESLRSHLLNRRVNNHKTEDSILEYTMVQSLSELSVDREMQSTST